jgi:hypothetical protein
VTICCFFEPACVSPDEQSTQWLAVLTVVSTFPASSVLRGLPTGSHRVVGVRRKSSKCERVNHCRRGRRLRPKGLARKKTPGLSKSRQPFSSIRKNSLYLLYFTIHRFHSLVKEIGGQKPDIGWAPNPRKAFIFPGNGGPVAAALRWIGDSKTIYLLH